MKIYFITISNNIRVLYSISGPNDAVVSDNDSKHPQLELWLFHWATRLQVNVIQRKPIVGHYQPKCLISLTWRREILSLLRRRYLVWRDSTHKISPCWSLLATWNLLVWQDFGVSLEMRGVLAIDSGCIHSEVAPRINVAFGLRNINLTKVDRWWTILWSIKHFCHRNKCKEKSRSERLKWEHQHILLLTS